MRPTKPRRFVLDPPPFPDTFRPVKPDLVSDIHIQDSAVLPAPEYLCREIPRDETSGEFILNSRRTIQEIIFGSDPRLLAVVGPCSIHDTRAGLEYARKLADLSRRVSDQIYLVMRVYFEKPRTTVGWKGLIMDPELDGSYNIPLGLKHARRFLLDVLQLNLPTATELLDPITPQYISDLISWSAIGARTTESQTHRQMASGLSMPLGFKNGTSGDIQVALNAILAAGQPQTFLGISHQGLASAVTTRGNPNCHLILRGGSDGANYHPEQIREIRAQMEAKSVRPAIMVDCSHGNSEKDFKKQPEVLDSIVTQVRQKESSLIGFMLESNLVEGKQSFPQPKPDLVHGQSITDGCISWETTEEILLEAHQALAGKS